MSSAESESAGRGTIIAIGASAGGVEALAGLVRHLPAALPAPVLVVLHVAATATSVLPDILDRASPLPAGTVTDGEPLVPGRIYVAPPDRHLVVEDGTIRLTSGPRENGHRPAIDTTFRSVARAAAHPIGVILSGTLDDGTAGMLAIHQAGGTVLVQDPAEALFDGMVGSVLRNVPVDATLPVAELAVRLVTLAQELTETERTSSMPSDTMVDAPYPSDDSTATRYTCPDCGGALWRHEDGGTIQFRCSVGHAYSPESFDGAQGREIESALWAAVRLIGDRTELLEEMAARAEDRGHDRTAGSFSARSADLRAAADTLRALIEGGRLPLDTEEPEA